jgi:hypothetical protein
MSARADGDDEPEYYLVCWMDWCGWRYRHGHDLLPDQMTRLRMIHVYTEHSRVELLGEIDWCDYQLSYLRHMPEQGEMWRRMRAKLVTIFENWPDAI